ncbi:thioesterase II family protein [Advenella kashmirensis]|uniref:thioesterase II family protein n=1 Tax=Advenella kashmirensis TaxID=310575 RepID=UPI00209D0A53|nr:alpha/beta fold hydrolase [Advenella kashmirensis]
MLSPWLRIYQPRPKATARIVCLPHAGGTASFFRDWNRYLPGNIELVAIQYPGRQERLDDELINNMAALTEELAEEIRPLLDRPYILFGHSMGAAVCHELCLLLTQRRLRLPERLIVSAREAPMHNLTGRLHLAPDSIFCEKLSSLGNTPPELLHSDEWRKLMLPVIRNDYQLIETYQPTQQSAPMPIRISAFVGSKDNELTIAQAADWSAVTSKPFELRIFEGDHFYLCERCAPVVTEAIRSFQLQLLNLSSDAKTWPSTP